MREQVNTLALKMRLQRADAVGNGRYETPKRALYGPGALTSEPILVVNLSSPGASPFGTGRASQGTSSDLLAFPKCDDDRQVESVRNKPFRAQCAGLIPRYRVIFRNAARVLTWRCRSTKKCASVGCDLQWRLLTTSTILEMQLEACEQDLEAYTPRYYSRLPNMWWRRGRQTATSRSSLASRSQGDCFENGNGYGDGEAVYFVPCLVGGF